MCVRIVCVSVCASLCAITNTNTLMLTLTMCASRHTHVCLAVTLSVTRCVVCGGNLRVYSVCRACCVLCVMVWGAVCLRLVPLCAVRRRGLVSCGAVSRHARPQEHIGTRRTNHTRPKGSQPPGSRQPAARSQALTAQLF